MKNRPQKDDLSQARDYALRLIKIRMRSCQELTQRLKRKGFDARIIKEVIKIFKSLGFLDDKQFSHLWLSSRLKRPLGFRRLDFELRQKGIDKEIIQTSIDKFKKDYDEYSIVKELTRQRLERYKDISPIKIKQRLYAYLLGRGFSPEVVHEVVNNYGRLIFKKKFSIFF